MNHNETEITNPNLALLQDQARIVSEVFTGDRYDLYGYPFMDYEIEFSWETREEYWRFREAWRLEYAELSELIREARAAYRGRHRDGSSSMADWRNCWPRIKAYCEARDLGSPFLGDEALVWKLKYHARFLLNVREVSRRRAGELRNRSMESKLSV